MKIISKYKDYYDYCQNLYGFDDLITFNRINEVEQIPVKKGYYYVYFLFYKTIYLNDDNKEVDFLQKSTKEIHCSKSYLFLNDQVYLITRSNNEFGKEISKIEPYYSREFNYNFGYLFDYMKQNKIPSLLLFKQNYTLGKNQERILNDVIELNPKLASLKFFNYLSAEKVYQEIEQFFINLKTNETIIEVDNKNKIIQAGFDLKTSFRKAKESK